ncbi:MAG: M81 family metallopeptidase [Planctomycetes bacterium]|nr:M81 family metallopeptidase [Planctomycetota bacterium]
MPRILIAECIHEVCSFNPVPTRYHDFFVMKNGEQVLAYHQGVGSEVGGALQVFAGNPGLEVIPTFGARGITSGGVIPAADFTRLADEFLGEIRNAPKPDGVYFALHGAMAAENELDPEGYLLAQTRKILGENVPIVVSYDLHGILTERMLEHANASVIYHTYPHVDFFETGQRAARLLLRIMAGEVKPVTARVEIPALVRGDELITKTGVFGEIVRSAEAIEKSPGGLSAGMFIGNPFTDVPDLRCYSVVVTDNDPARAEAEAIRLANDFWPRRAQMQAKLTSVAESVRLAGETKGTAILVDAADATSSGASGDSNAILRALLEAGYAGKALIPIVDAGAVEAAMKAGIGGTIQTTVGGTCDPRRFQPLPITANVRMLSDGRFRSESFGQEWYGGNTAVLQMGAVSLIVTSRPVHLYDRSLFYAHGQDPKQFDLVVVKSPHCQRHMFADWCGRLINVDAPGSTSANVKSLGHTICHRPIYPLDGDVAFVPKAKIFSRGDRVK